MPRVECDSALQERLNQVVRTVGNPSAAAAHLGLERTLVWRFFKTGRAIPRTRFELEVALDAYARRIEKKFDSATKTETNAPFLRFGELSSEDFRQMRKYFQGMIAVMDFYEKNGLGAFPQAEVVFSAGGEK